MKKIKKYWKGLAELNNDPLVEKLSQNEFLEEIPVDEFLSKEESSSSPTSRRDFLKFLGFSTAAATLAACETPIQKVIPYVIKPNDVIPGVANYYATAIYDGHDFSSVLVKTREGRPIKIDGNKESGRYNLPNARVQASVLSLYDSSRLRKPIKNIKSKNFLTKEWDTVDQEIKKKLSSIKKKKGKIALLTSSIISPSTKLLIKEFKEKYNGNVDFIQMDAISYSEILDQNKTSFGIRALPNYRFDKAKTIVSFGVDFLGNWLDSNYAKQYIDGRNPISGEMSVHYQLESTLSLTGSNADYRIQIKPSEQEYLLHKIYNYLVNRDLKKIPRKIRKLAQELESSKRRSIVLSSSNNRDIQTLVNAINIHLENYDNTIFISESDHCVLKQGDDNRVNKLIKDMKRGKIDALITYNVNPSYTLINAEEFNKSLKNVGTTIAISSSNNETNSRMKYVLPDTHNLESWGDACPSKDSSSEKYYLMQPTIQPIFKGRQFQDNLLYWISEKRNYYTYLKDYYRNQFYKDLNDRQWRRKWERSLEVGYFERSTEPLVTRYSIGGFLFSRFMKEPLSFRSNGIELETYEKISMGDGTQSNNPWLQELPDPISRACWDNYLTISASTARKLKLRNWNVENGGLNGNLVDIKVGKNTLRNVPVMIQPGQANGTVSLALGYGRVRAGKAGNGIGVNAFPFVKGGKVKIKKVNGEHEFAATQLHHTMMGRSIVKETTLSEYKINKKSGNEDTYYHTHQGKKKAAEISLWDDHDHTTGHFWNLSIDLTKCIGCSACVISCHAENNVAVVGKEEVRKSRDMHWLRIDRYFSSDMTEETAKKKKVSSVEKYREMERPQANPEVVYQPVMCQHCNHAPCETVCPVAATSHGKEGQNHMAYNRCVGTRYCSNNCPYKVRRFNWFQYSDNDKFDYNMNDDYGKMVLNPDVVVRSRGVMEKCSMCIQRIQEIKLEAKNNGEKVDDQNADTACSSVCPTGALVFGDVNDTTSEVHKLKKDPRAYHLLEHLNVSPSVFYQTKIRSK